MFSDNSLLTIGNVIHGLYYLPIKVENQALVASQKRKVSFEEPIKQTLKKQRINPTSTNPSTNIEDLTNKANKALQKVKHLEQELKALKKANKYKRADKETLEAKKAKKATLSLQHQRLGHISEKAVRHLLKEVYPNKITPKHPIRALDEHFRLYKPCRKAIFTNKVNKVSRNSSKEYKYLEKVSSDIYGPIRP